MRPAVQEQLATDEATQIEVAADALGQPIPLDLHPALAVLGYYDGVYVVISDLPVGARLSAGRSNGNFTWSLLPAELESLSLILPAHRTQVMLTVSIVTPDPDGYEFASTSAQFNVIVADGISTVPFNSLRRIEAPHHEDEIEQRGGRAKRSRLETILGDELPIDRHPMVRSSTAAAGTPEHDAAAEARLLAAARLEWRADEEARMMRSRESWEADAADRWVRRSAELAEQHARELRDAEARWHARELERVVVTEAMWSARLAAQEVSWRSEESTRFAAALASWQAKVRAERWRRAAAWFVFSLTIGSLMLA
jgi:hypothetical protein